MNPAQFTREELWVRRQLTAADIDQRLWERDRALLTEASRLSGSCIFVVDTFRCAYVYASGNFAHRFGYDAHRIATIERQSDYLESRIHPDDRMQMLEMQVRLGQFIYAQPPAERNDYCNHFGFRLLDARGQYVDVVSHHRVLEQDRNGRAWLVAGSIDIAPIQRGTGRIACTVENLKNGTMFSPLPESALLTPRETEILQLIERGFQSKEIASGLSVSIHTVNIHRQNLLRKLNAQYVAELIRAGRQAGLLD